MVPQQPPQMPSAGMQPRPRVMTPQMSGMSPRSMAPPQAGRGFVGMPPQMVSMPPQGMAMSQQQMPVMQGRMPGPPQMNGGIKFSGTARNQPMQMMGVQQMGMPLNEPLNDEALAAADPHMQKNMIGEKLYPLIYQSQPSQAGKITGMLLEMDNAELLNLIESPEALASKIDEALIVLKNHNAMMAAQSSAQE